MPKLFTVTIGIEEIAFGRVMRLLHHTEGVAKIDWDMGDAFPAKANGAERAPHKRGAYGMTGKDFIVQALVRANKPVRGTDFKRLFEKDGRPGSSIASPINELRERGLISSTPEGYVLTRKMKDRLRHRKEA